MTRSRALLLAALLVTLLVAGGVSQYASSAPDGLTKVAEDTGLASAERRHAGGDSPLAGYAADWLPGDGMSRAVAGVAGVVVTLAVGCGVFVLVRRGDDRSRQHTSRG